MIVACPECSGPFEIPDDQIAALVQIACPTCGFRMILDFAAANDPALVEEGMRMASGYRHAGDYWAAVSSGHAVAAAAPAATPPHLQPVPEPAPEPEPQPRVAAAPAEAARQAPPVAPEPAEPAPLPMRQPATAPAAERPRPAARSGKTVVGPLPPPPGEPPPVEAPTPAERDDARPQPGVPQAPLDTDEVAVEVDRPAEEAPATAKAPPVDKAPPVEERPSPRRPPHTPPTRAVPTGAVADEAAPAEADADSDTDLGLSADDETEVARSGLGTWLVAALVLLALGLVGASVALKGTPDPRPLLEDLYRQVVKQ